MDNTITNNVDDTTENRQKSAEDAPVFQLTVKGQTFTFSETGLIGHNDEEEDWYWKCLLAYPELSRKISGYNYTPILAKWRAHRQDHGYDMTWIKTFLLYDLCIQEISKYTTILGKRKSTSSNSR